MAKILQKDILNAILAECEVTDKFGALDSAVVAEWAEKKIAQLNNKNSTSTVKRNEEQEAFLEILKDIMAEVNGGNGVTVSQMLANEQVKGFPWKDGNPTSSQRITGILNKVIQPDDKHPDRSGDIYRFMVKKVAYFRLA